MLPGSASGTTVTRQATKLERVGAHSHVRGLGLDPSANGFDVTGHRDGLVGQYAARRAMGIVAALVREGQSAGRAVLLAGPPGTGKTALAMGLSQVIAKEHHHGGMAKQTQSPFTMIAASEIFSLDMGKTEALTQAFRRSVGITVEEETEVLEGEVVEIVVERPQTNPALRSSRIHRSGSLTLKTTAMESVFDLGQKMIDALQRERITAGDIISIDKATGRVSRLGRSFARSKDFDATLRQDEFLPTPDGELQRRKATSQTVTLHDMDVINSKQRGGNAFLALFTGDTGEIPKEVREQVDRRISEWRTEGRATFKPGVLFIDEVHMLDLECFAWLNRALESPLAPVVVMATNRTDSHVRGAFDQTGPFGLPRDMLDRTHLVQTILYTPEELKAIIEERCHEEDATVEDRATDTLVELAVNTGSLRYALQLISPAQILATRRHAQAVSSDDVAKASELFWDTARSVKYMETAQSGFV